jgi:uncharacterized membrane protein (DUF485 family)
MKLRGQNHSTYFDFIIKLISSFHKLMGTILLNLGLLCMGVIFIVGAILIGAILLEFYACSLDANGI